MDIQTKICPRCKIEKSVECYSKNKNSKDGLHSYCKDCKNHHNKQYRQENLEKERERHKKYDQKRLKTDPKFKLDKNMSRSIHKCLKSKGLSKKETGWQKAVGYTVEQLKEHLEKQFDDKMTWENQGTYWHIDHIKPKSLFEYDSIDHPEFKKCWSLDNLQPLEAIENLKKSNKYSEEGE